MKKARMCPVCKRMLIITIDNIYPQHFTLTASAMCVGSRKKAI